MLQTIQEDQIMTCTLSICSDYSTLNGIPVLEIKTPGYVIPPKFNIPRAFALLGVMVILSLILFSIDPYYGLAGSIATIMMLIVMLIQQVLSLREVVMNDSLFARSSDTCAVSIVV